MKPSRGTLLRSLIHPVEAMSCYVSSCTLRCSRYLLTPHSTARHRQIRSSHPKLPFFLLSSLSPSSPPHTLSPQTNQNKVVPGCFLFPLAIQYSTAPPSTPIQTGTLLASYPPPPPRNQIIPNIPDAGGSFTRFH